MNEKPLSPSLYQIAPTSLHLTSPGRPPSIVGEPYAGSLNQGLLLRLRVVVAASRQVVQEGVHSPLHDPVVILQGHRRHVPVHAREVHHHLAALVAAGRLECSPGDPTGFQCSTNFCPSNIAELSLCAKLRGVVN